MMVPIDSWWRNHVDTILEVTALVAMICVSLACLTYIFRAW